LAIGPSGIAEGMPADTDALERQLVNDLAGLGDRMADERFCQELYRALTNNEWKRQGTDGAIALSWTLADRLINDVHAAHGRPAMTLAQTGGEGEVSQTVQDVLGELGWSHHALDTSRNDPRHVSEPAHGAPPPHGGSNPSTEERFAGAHEEAEYNRLVPPGEREPGTLDDKLGRKA
jgi:hypothetical protein